MNGTVTIYLLTLGAALLFGVGTVAQQHAAEEAPRQDVMSVKLLWYLVRRRVWLIGIAVAAVGNGLAATALGLGSVALVEPLLVVRLLFALPLAAAWHRARVPARDWVAAVGTAVGLAVFIVAGNPSQISPDRAPDHVWAIALLALVAGAVVLAGAGRQRHVETRALMLAVGAGFLFALQDALISTAIQLPGSLFALVTTWYPYVVVAMALGGTLFIQSAYELAPLPASFPAQVSTEPVIGIVLGVAVLDGSVRLTPLALAFEAVGLAVMIGGIFALARSPLVMGPSKHDQPKRAASP